VPSGPRTACSSAGIVWMSGNSSVHSAVAAALAAYFDGLHGCDVERLKDCWHPSGELYGVGPDSSLVTRDAEKFFAGIVTREKSPELAKEDKILSLTVLDEYTAAAKVQITLPPSTASPIPAVGNTVYTDFLVLLLDATLGWKIISKVFASGQASNAIASKDFVDVLEAANRYLAAGRAQDGAGMAKVFHPSCRLTFSLGGSITIISSAQFCERVEKRWEMDIHKAWSHLKDDPRIASGDTLLGVDFAGPKEALVTLKVGYPPFLYTDFLSFCKLGEGEAAQWWITAKSSCNVPFLAEEGKQT